MPGVLAAVVALSVAFGGIMASDTLFAGMLTNLLHLPMQVYQQHSMGQFINRYSSDIAEIDYVMPYSVRSMANIILQLLSVVIIIVYAAPIFGFIAPVLAILYYAIEVCVCVYIYISGLG